MDINIISEFWPGWEIEEEIGRGAFGSVYKARHSEYGETFYRAIKHMTIPQNPYSLESLYAEGIDEKSVTIFYQNIVNDCVNEIKVMERLKGHSNIVNVDDFKVIRRPGEVRWDIFIRMELLRTLTDYMKGRRFSQQEVRKIGMDLCAGLVRCEKEHVIHRDIKPENVFVSRSGDFKLGDFGIARKIEGAAAEMSQKGTVGFMAPEVYFGKAYDQRVDIYSLGLLLYLLLNNNRMPFLDPEAPMISFQERENATKYRLRGEVLPRPCDADNIMAKIILKACSFNPDDRYYSAEEMLWALTEMKAEKASILDSLKKKGNSIPRQNNKNKGNTRRLSDAISIRGKADSAGSNADYVRRNRDTGSKHSEMPGTAEQNGGLSYAGEQSTEIKRDWKKNTGTYHNQNSVSKINLTGATFGKRDQSPDDHLIEAGGRDRRKSGLIPILLILLVLITGGVAIGTVLSKGSPSSGRKVAAFDAIAPDTSDAEETADASDAEETADASDTRKTAAANTKKTDPASAASSGDAEYYMTLILSQRDLFLSTLELAAHDQAEEMGITLTVMDAQYDVSKQLQYIETAVNAGESAVIVNIADAATGEECIEAAGDIPIVFVNRAPLDTTLLDEYENASLVASDDRQAGEFQAEYLAEYFQDKGQTDIKYILVSGILGLDSTTKRTTSVVEGLKEAGIHAEEVATLVCDYDRAEAQTQISPLLETEEFDCVIANNDDMALGVIEAMKAADIDPSSVPVVGIECTEDAAQSVKDGEMYMTVFQNPVGQGAGAVIAAKNMIEGKAINDGTDYELSEESESIMWIPFEPVTKDYVDDYL